MLWLFMSLLGALSQSTMDLFSKKSLQSLDEYVVAFSSSFFASLFLLPLLLITPIPSLNDVFWITLFLNGGLRLASSVLYMKAIKTSPLSLTVPMLAFTPLFLLVTSPLILGEHPSSSGLTGVLLIVLGTYTLSIKDVKEEGYFAPFKSLARERGPLMMLFVAVIFGVNTNLSKMGVQQSNSLLFSTVSNALSSALLFPLMLAKSNKSVRDVRVNLKGLITLGFFWALMYIFTMKALELAIVPYVISVMRMNVIFSTLYGYFFFKEERITERLAGALIMVLGVFLITMYS